jgi:hypothetical protein
MFGHEDIPNTVPSLSRNLEDLISFDFSKKFLRLGEVRKFVVF